MIQRGNMDIQSVALVVDPDIGEKLELLSQQGHVWLVDTLLNRAHAYEAWGQAELSLAEKITTFRANLGETPDQTCLRMLPAIEKHSAGKPYGTLEVFGVKLADTLKAELASRGFRTVEPTESGFRAVK